jgi:putative metalloenzyme radical SAM/SPASM domain maturase
VKPEKSKITPLHKLNHPSAVYLETTTRCNLNCNMCVKNTGSGYITDRDFPANFFTNIAPALPYAETLILNGIGEPLLYPRLEELIQKADALMTSDARIGFQSNGMLLNPARADKLVKAGLNLLCISMDSLNPELFKAMRNGAELANVAEAFAAVNSAAYVNNKNVKTGIEFVLTKKNIHDLPDVIEKASAYEISFFIVTHLIPYTEEMLKLTAYENNTDIAVELYGKYLNDSINKGIDITRYNKYKWKFRRNQDEELVVETVENMLKEAHEKNIFINLNSLMNRDTELANSVEKSFTRAEKIAEVADIELILPGISPCGIKKCSFLEKGSVFISASGDVHPCHFLWHKYQCYVSGWKKYVNPVSFGNLREKNLLEIWNSEDFIKFRNSASQYDYPLCSNCTFSPCDYIYSEVFEQDCYINHIPCCDCQWCLGIFHCLG